MVVAQHTEKDWIEGEDGNRRPNIEHISRARLRVDTRKFIAAKLKPKKYGDKVDLNHSGRIDGDRTGTPQDQEIIDRYFADREREKAKEVTNA